MLLHLIAVWLLSSARTRPAALALLGMVAGAVVLEREARIQAVEAQQ